MTQQIHFTVLLALILRIPVIFFFAFAALYCLAAYQEDEENDSKPKQLWQKPILLVVGAAITLSPFAVPVENTLLNTGLNLSLVFDLPVMLCVMLLLSISTLFKKKLGRWQGITLLCVYAAFCVLQFIL